MAQDFDDRFFGDFGSFFSTGTEVKSHGLEAQCFFCGHSEKVMKMYNDEELGWVHWGCIKGYRKLTRQEENFEALMELGKLFNGGK